MGRIWEQLASEVVAHFRVFQLVRERYRSARTGDPVDAVIVDSPDWVNIIALTPDAQVVLVRQFRFGPRAVALEIPGGMIDPGEAPLQSAQRELREETGYVAQHWTALGSTQPNPAFMRNRLHTFLAEGARLAGEQALDHGEDIAVELVPLDQIDALLAAGAIDHALVAVAFHKLDLLRRGHSFDGDQ